MGLRGNLEDLPLLDILQIVAFSKKTGHLQIETGLGQGAVVFKEGLVVCAYTWSTLAYLRQIAGGDYGSLKETMLQDQIEISLRELARLREGSFDFKLSDRVTSSLDGVDVAPFLLFEGINPHHLLLDLARELDEDRRDTTELLKSTLESLTPQERPSVPLAESAQDSKPPDSKSDPSEVDANGAGITLVLVDDEPRVAEVLGGEFRARGYRVLTADNPAGGAELIQSVAAAGERLLALVDLCMPTSNGRSFHGGFELIRTLKRARVKLPLVLMAERLSETTRARAKDLGIRRVALKPALSKLDPEQYAHDLRAFVQILEPPLRRIFAGTATSSDLVPEGLTDDGGRLLDFLTSMTAKLMDPERSVDISGLVLQVAARYVERGILFLVRTDQAAGLAGFGLEATAEIGRAQQLNVDLRQVAPFAEVVKSRRLLRLESGSEALSGLYARVDRGRADESILVPMLNNGEVLAILYADNATTGKPLGKLRGLELFVAQASMALENVFLHRKLREQSERSLAGERP